MHMKNTTCRQTKDTSLLSVKNNNVKTTLSSHGMHALYSMQRYTCTYMNVYLYNRNYLKGIHPVPMSKS